MKKRTAVLLLSQILLLVVIAVLLLSARNFLMPHTALGKISYIKDVSVSIDGAPAKEISLPHSFSHLPPRTPVTITAHITPEAGDVIYIKTVYSPAKIYADNVLIYEFGRKSSYPNFMIDPATEVYIADPGIFGKEITLRMDFLSPVSRKVLTVHPPIMGSIKTVFLTLAKTTGMPFVFSAMQLLAGVLLVCISAFVLIFERKGSMFFWLGVFSLATGAWAFGECNFTGLLIKNPTLLYLLAFIGLFTFSIPLLQFAMASINFKNPKPIHGLSICMTVLCIAACLLQLEGIVPFSQSMYLFHLVVPLTICFLAGATIYESLRYQDVGARRFVIPIVVLAVSALLEVINYQIRFTYRFASLFQIGILFFILSTGITAGLYIRDMVKIRKRQEELSFEMRLMELQSEEQKKHRALMAENERLLKQQRHDLRHHLTAIKELSFAENSKLRDYLNSLMDNIPHTPEAHCENRSVNSVVCHYAGLCEKYSISLSVNISVPEDGTQVSDSDLCVIFGNLLENAVDACNQMTDGDKFIDLKSTLHLGLLTITMDNSFDGHFTLVDGRARSSKRNDFGIGLSSIQSAARKHGGDTEFKTNGTVFLSSVYLRL